MRVLVFQRMNVITPSDRDRAEWRRPMEGAFAYPARNSSSNGGTMGSPNMTDIAPASTAIALGLMLLACGLAWLWIGFEEVLKQRKAWRMRRGRWMKLLK